MKLYVIKIDLNSNDLNFEFAKAWAKNGPQADELPQGTNL